MSGKKDLTTETARHLYNAYESDEIFSAVIFGQRGYGKSSFCMKILYDLFHNGLGYGYNPAWNKVLENTLHSKKMFSEKFDNLREEDDKARGLHLDDAEQWLSSLVWQKKGNKKERKLMEEIRTLLPAMRTRSSGNLFSCDNPLKLDTSIRDRPLKRIKIVKIDNPKFQRPRQARVYSQDVYPSLTQRIDGDSLWTHDFDATLPDEVFRKYNKMRKSYSDRAIEQISQSRKELTDDGFEERFKVTLEQAAAIYIANEDASYRNVGGMTDWTHPTISKKVKELKEEGLDKKIKKSY